MIAVQKIIDDIPKKAKFHSCIISSFAFDFYFFDLVARRQLRQKGIHNIIILCDARMLDESFGQLSRLSTHISRDYTIVPIDAKACFHPKLFAFIGQDNLMLHVGSGNLTASGFGKNHELFSTLSCSSKEDPQYPLILNGINYLHHKIKDSRGFVSQQLRWIKDYCNLITDYSVPLDAVSTDIDQTLSMSLLSNGNESIYANLLGSLSPIDIKSISIVSPYYDGNANTIHTLHQDFPNAKIKIYIDQLIPQEIESLMDQDHITLLDWGQTERGKKVVRGFTRRIHAKIFVLESDNDTYVLHGSPNATLAGLGIGNGYHNEEAAILYQYQDQSVLEDMGLLPQEAFTSKEIKGTRITIPNPEENTIRTRIENRILGADRSRSGIHVYLDSVPVEDCHLVFIDINGEEIIKLPTDGKIELIFSFADFQDLRRTAAMYLMKNGDRISTNAYVSELEYLHKGNPDRSNQQYQKLISSIELGDMSEFAVLDHLATIMSDRDKGHETKTRSIARAAKIITVTLTYEEAKAANEAEMEADNYDPLDTSKKILDAMNTLIEIANKSKQESKHDQDEEGATDDGAITSYTQKEKESTKSKVFRNESSYDKEKKKILKLYGHYIDDLASKTYDAEEEESKIRSADLSFFIVLYLQLIHITNKPYGIKGEESENILIQEVGAMSELETYDSISLSLIGHFLLYINKYDLMKYEDDYSNDELQRYLEQLSLLIHLGLAIHAKVKPNDSDWIDLLYANCKYALPKCEIEDIVNTHDRLQSISIDITPLDLDDIKALDARATALTARLSDDLSEGNYTLIDRIGIVHILKSNPKHDPKVLRVEFPGINYHKMSNKYIYPKGYMVKTDKWLKINKS